MKNVLNMELGILNIKKEAKFKNIFKINILNMILVWVEIFLLILFQKAAARGK